MRRYLCKLGFGSIHSEKPLWGLVINKNKMSAPKDCARHLDFVVSDHVSLWILLPFLTAHLLPHKVMTDLYGDTYESCNRVHLLRSIQRSSYQSGLSPDNRAYFPRFKNFRMVKRKQAETFFPSSGAGMSGGGGLLTDRPTTSDRQHSSSARVRYVILHSSAMVTLLITAKTAFKPFVALALRALWRCRTISAEFRGVKWAI